MANVALSLGITVATNFLLGLFKNNEKVETDLPDAEFGSGIPKYYGIVRHDGCSMFWATEIVQGRRGGKGGKGGAEFSVNAAFLIGEPIDSVRRIWANGKLVYSTIGDSETGTSASNFLSRYCNIYTGNQTAPDSVIASYDPDPPAFVNRSYLVLHDYPTDDFGGGSSLPKIDVEVISSENPTLSSIFSDVCIRAGLSPSEFNVSKLVGNVKGIPFKQSGEAYREFLENLMQLYQIITYEENGVVHFLHQMQDKIRTTLGTNDLASGEAEEEIKDRYIERTISDRELPSKVEIEFRNIEDDHEAGFQFAFNPVRTYDTPVSVNTDWVATNNEVLTQSTRILAQLDLQKTRYEGISLLPSWYGLKVGDVVNLPVRGAKQPIQIEKINVGANLILQIDGYVYGGITPAGTTPNITNLNTVYTTNQTTTITHTPTQNITVSGVAEVVPLDIPLLDERDSEKGIYIAISAPETWKIGQLFVSEDNANFTGSMTLTDQSVIGTVAEILPGGFELGDIDITSVLTVTLSSGIVDGLEPSTQSEFEANKHLALIGKEIIVFKNATETTPGVWSISHFKRGYKGTESQISTHTSNERFVLLTGYLERLEGTSDQIGKTIYLKAPHQGQVLEDVPISSILITGESLKPLQVKDAIGNEDPANNLLISWVAQSRGVGITEGEEVEKYEIDIQNGSGTVLRTLTTDKSSVIYLAEDRATDGLEDAIRLTIYKISSAVGRGYPKSVNPLVFGNPINSATTEVANHATAHLAGGSDPIAWSTVHGSGTLTARPVATSNNFGYLYLVTDVNGGILYRSDGTNWVQCAPGVNQAGSGAGFDVDTILTYKGEVLVHKGNVLITV